jgi:hypothetical protein
MSEKVRSLHSRWLVLASLVVMLGAALPLVLNGSPAVAQTAVSPFVGFWDFTSAGDDPGSGRATVADDGTITGSGQTRLAGAITVSGTVSPDGTFTFTGAPAGTPVGEASTRATFTGQVTAANEAVGTWVNTFANLKGIWSARRVEPPAPGSATTTPVSTTTPEEPTDTVPVVNNLDGIVVGDNPAWKTFRSPGSVIRCMVNRGGGNERTWSNARGGIRFSWPKNGRFSLEVANSPEFNTVAYAHFYFEAYQLKLGSQWAQLAKNQRKSRFIYDILPALAPKKSRILRGEFENVYITLKEGTKLYERAVGILNFSYPSIAGYCSFDLRVSPKSR